MIGAVLAIGLSASMFALIAGFSWYFDEHRRRLEELRQVDVTPIADAKAGELVRIVGVLKKHEALVAAPLSGRLCAHYEVRVLEYVSSGRSGRWQLRFRETESRSFVVADASGRALVDVRSFECAVVRDQNRRSGTFQDATPELEAILARNAMQSTGLLGLNRSLRYEEGVLELGERVTVLGRARWEDDPDDPRPVEARAGYRENARRQRLVIEAGVRPVRASDDLRVTSA